MDYANTTTFHSPLFSRKIVEIECYALRVAILDECQNYLGAGSSLGGSEKNSIGKKAQVKHFANGTRKHARLTTIKTVKPPDK